MSENILLKVKKRFLNYIKIDTQSDENSQTCPSTKKQLHFGKKLVKELLALGIKKAVIDKNGYVMATLPSNIKKKVPTIGLIAHMDTSPDMSGKGVTPQIIENYNGKNIILNKEKGIVLSINDFPEITAYQGETLITTNGTTLLGADDKAGIAEIITALEYFIKHPEIKHGTIKIAFTPDEEIGQGAKHFNVKKFRADFAYTIDGGEIGELEYETFNAAKAIINISGRNIHPGYAKNKLINSMQIAFELNSLLPVSQRPEYTTGDEGFFHLISMCGNVEESQMHYILRDHNKKKFTDKKELLKKVITFLNKKYSKDLIFFKIEDQYYNMKEKIIPVFKIVELAKRAMQEAKIEPIIKPVRGGTDGALLSYMGLPTPNIFTGGHNFHGKYEFISLHSMQKAVEVILNIIQLNAL